MGAKKVTRTAATIEKGDRFGALVVKCRGRDDKEGRPRYWCLCDCGKRKLVSGRNLAYNLQRSCGCAKKGYVIVPITEYKCVETGEIFKTINSINAYASTTSRRFKKALDQIDVTAGIHPETGEPLHWETHIGYRKKYIGKTRSTRDRYLCVTTGIRYRNLQEASKKTGTYSAQITYACDGYSWSAGVDPETGIPLVWERLW